MLLSLTLADDIVGQLRVWGGLLGMAFGILGGLVGMRAWYRTTTRLKTNETLESTVDTYKQLNDALKLQNADQATRYAEAMTTIAARDKQVTALIAKTDISPVMQWLTDAQQRGQTQVSDLMAMLTTSFKALSVATTENAAATRENVTQSRTITEYLVKLLQSTENLSRRLGRVEKGVVDLQEGQGVEPAAEVPDYSGAKDRRKEPRK